MCARPATTCPFSVSGWRGITQVLVIPPLRVIAPAHVEWLPGARIGQTVNLVLLLVVRHGLCAALKRLDLIVRPLAPVHDVCLSRPSAVSIYSVTIVARTDVVEETLAGSFSPAIGIPFLAAPPRWRSPHGVVTGTSKLSEMHNPTCFVVLLRARRCTTTSPTRWPRPPENWT
jgi:hypothetical protein